FTPQELADAVARKDAAALARVRGVGKRTAERMVLELQGKLAPAAPGGLVAVASNSAEDDAAAALVAFGYTPAEAAAALAGVPGPAAASSEERVMLALRQLDRLRG
ncbi:MAG TPA: helix-hairpin-helix domain-containing protein, partial [Dehalococcoidia bacterium]|nr:helix-hairpin-helix domain-containing protein [Dehalococcoidia bacterium]